MDGPLGLQEVQEFLKNYWTTIWLLPLIKELTIIFLLDVFRNLV